MKTTRWIILGALLLVLPQWASADYDTWKTIITNGQNAPLQDADNDGVANLVEYAFKLDPMSSSSNGALMEVVIQNGTPVLEYNRNQDVNANQIELEFSNDLSAGWQTATYGVDYTEQEIGTYGSQGYNRYRLSFTGTIGSAKYIRTRVHLNPNTTSRPNIIMLFSDDQQDNSFGAMGHPWAQTPNIDNLINNGVRFSNTYVAEPTCCPSRVSLFTGMHERVNGVGFTSNYEMTEDMWSRTYPALLRASGYYTGFLGKFGIDYYRFNAADKFDYWMAHDGWSGFFPVLDTSSTWNTAIYTNMTPSSIGVITEIMGDSMIDFLNQAPKSKPFCLQVSFSAPHGSVTGSMRAYHHSAFPGIALPADGRTEVKQWATGSGETTYTELYRDPSITMGYGHDAASFVKATVPPAINPYQYIPIEILDHTHGRNIWPNGDYGTYYYNYTVGSNTEHRVRYYQCISGIDRVVGNLMDELKARGLDQNTVILYGSDNGLFTGELGMGGKSLLYDQACQIPCFIYDPRQPQSERGKDLPNLVSSLDLTSTILDLAGVAQPWEMEGQSLMPLVEGSANSPNRDYLFLESLFSGRDNPYMEGIRKGKWKYIRMFLDDRQGANNNWGVSYFETDVDFSGMTPDFEQLFDLDQDPGEENSYIEVKKNGQLKSGVSPDVVAAYNDLKALCVQESVAINQRRQQYMTGRPDAIFTAGSRMRFPYVSAHMTIKPEDGNPLGIVFDGSRSRVRWERVNNQNQPNSIASYAWDFGDGSTATGQKVTHRYAANGTYQARLITTETYYGGLKATNTVMVTLPFPETYAPAGPTAVAVSGIVAVTGDPYSSGGTYGTSVAKTLDDGFSYDFNNPAGASPDSTYTECFLFDSGSGGDAELIYDVVDVNGDSILASITGGHKLFVDIYARSGFPTRSANIDVKLYKGSRIGTEVGSVTGLNTGGGHVRGEITPTGDFDTIVLIGKGDGVNRNNFDIAEVRFATDQ